MKRKYRRQLSKEASAVYDLIRKSLSALLGLKLTLKNQLNRMKGFA